MSLLHENSVPICMNDESIHFRDARCEFQMYKNLHTIEILLEGELEHGGSQGCSEKVKVAPSFKHVN